jgi:NAD(P)-dependent dehydrogenase (short-subunit alcohol dehydrogenase family)
MTYWQAKRAIVTGGSSGLGRALARALAARGARVAIVARGQPALDEAVAELKTLPLAPVEDSPGRGKGRDEGDVFAIAADVTNADDVARLADTVQQRWGGVDFFCHAAGRSMRGDVLTTSPEQFQELWELNTLAAVRCVQALATPLVAGRGHIVLVGSLASKVAPRYLGAYPASKFPLAAVAQQLRMEVGPLGVHTLLVCPGPIARDDTASRYADQAAALPASAHRPGGGAQLKTIDPDQLARQILRACERRQAELIVPGKSRLLFALAQLSPRLGDWLLRKSMADN